MYICMVQICNISEFWQLFKTKWLVVNKICGPSNRLSKIYKSSNFGIWHLLAPFIRDKGNPITPKVLSTVNSGKNTPKLDEK